MKAVAVLFVLTILLTLLLRRVSSAYGSDVGSRFLERLNYIPSQSGRPLSRDSLADWLSDPSLTSARAGYTAPILFPLDLMFLVAVGVLLGFGSSAFAERFPFLAAGSVAVWWILPAAYMLADLAEDFLIIGLLKGFVALTDRSFSCLRVLTKLKIGSITAAIGQFAILGVMLLLRTLLPTAA